MAKFPPLPEPEALGMDFDKGWDGVRAYGFTAEQMRARDLEIWRMAMEAAAAECASRAVRMATDLQERGARECEHAIRALPEPSHQ